MSYTITVIPHSSLIDEDVSIKVTGLLPEQKVTLRAFTTIENGDMFESHAFYQADKDGSIDLEKQASSGGMFTGIEPMGLFWALERSGLNKRKYARMIKKDVTTPLIVEISTYDSWLGLDTMHKISPLVTVDIEKWFKHLNVKREPIRVGKIRGTLFTPPGDGPFKSVIDMFGGAGGLFEYRASMLASRDFLTLSLAIFDYEDLPTMDSVDLNYFEEATQLLQSHPKHHKGGVGVIAVSMGADIALAMGAYVPGITCSICINGCMYTLFDFTFRGYSTKICECSFEKIKYVKPDVVSMREIWNFPKKQEVQKQMIQFYKSNANTLFLWSGDDQTFDTELILDRMKEVLRRYYGGQGNYKYHFYPGAGHLLELPNTPCSSTVYVGRMRLYELYGGQKEPHAGAQKHSWKEILKFLNENIIITPKSRL